MKSLIGIILCVLGFNLTAVAQIDTSKQDQLYVITKTDGKEYIGKILSDDGREVLIETEALGKIYIPKSDIASIVLVEKEKDIFYGEYRGEGPFTTRYTFTTNALPIKRGENYALIQLYGPEVHFAVADNFNVGIMTTWGVSPLVLALKYSFKTKNEMLNFSIGSLNGTSGYFNNFRGFNGLHFANITYGNRLHNITLSAGYGYLRSGFNNNNYFEPGTFYNNSSYPSYEDLQAKKAPLSGGPIVSVAGVTSVGAKASFVFDSMIGWFTNVQSNVETTELTPPSYSPEYIPGYYQHVVSDVKRTSMMVLIMPGIRYQKTPNKAFQFSMAGVNIIHLKGYLNKSTLSFPVPVLSWFVKF